MKLPEKVFIVAGNHGQYRQFAQFLRTQLYAEGIHVGPTDLVYVSSADVLRGFRDVWGYKVGTWKDRQDINQLTEILRTTGCLDNFIEVEY